MDRKLLVLIGAATLLSVGHSVDHAVRDDFRWGTAELAAFAAVSLVLYGALGVGLYLYAKGRVGPRFWTFFAAAGVLFAWAAHFSPFTAQPPSYILRAYGYGPAGWAALAVLCALVAVIAVAGAYAAFLWRREDLRKRRQAT